MADPGRWPGQLSGGWAGPPKARPWQRAGGQRADRAARVRRCAGRRPYHVYGENYQPNGVTVVSGVTFFLIVLTEIPKLI